MRSDWVEATTFFDTPMSGKFLPPLSGDDYLHCSDELVLTHADIILEQLRTQAALMRNSPLTCALAERTVLAHSTLSEIVASVLSEKLRPVIPPDSAEMAGFEHEMGHLLKTHRLLRCLVCDLYKIVSVDPASDGMLQPLLFFKGFHAVCLYHIAHALWMRNGPADRFAALRLQSIGAEMFSVDIHPAAQIGPGVMIDHASGVVIGGTAIVGSDIYMLHQVTLGATGKPMYGAKRHPTISDGVILGAGATVLGDIVIGKGVTVGASAIVTRPVPQGCTVVGVNKILDNREQEQDGDAFTWFYDI
jgi:serine O-acetyltransferase